MRHPEDWKPRTYALVVIALFILLIGVQYVMYVVVE